MSLVLVGDGACLAPYVAGVVPEPRDGDLRDEDLRDVAARANHASAVVQAARDRRPLVHLVEDAGVVLRELDAVGHISAVLCVVVGIVQAGEPVLAFHRLAGIRAGTGVGKPGLAALLLGGGVCEQPRLGLPERVDVTAVVCKNRAGCLRVAHARELKLEVDAVKLALGFKLGNLVA